MKILTSERLLRALAFGALAVVPVTFAFAQTAPAEPAVPPPAAASAAEQVPMTPPPPPAPPLPEDRRDRVLKVCMDAAEAKAKEINATVQMGDVKDTDLKSGGVSTMRASVKLTTVDSKGKSKTKNGTFGCSTKDDVVTSFKFD